MRGRRLQKLLSLTGFLTLMVIFVGLVGKTEVNAYEVETKTTTVTLKDENGNVIPNSDVNLKVGVWDIDDNYMPVTLSENDQGQITCTITGDYEWYPVSFEVEADGYHSKTVSGYRTARSHISNYSGKQEQFCWWFNYLPTEITIYLQTYTPTAQKNDCYNDAISEIEKYAKSNEYLDESVPDAELTDQDQVNDYVKTYKGNIEEIDKTLSVAEYREAVEAQVLAAKNAIKLVPTKQSRMNEQYYNRIKITKGTKEVGMTLNTTEENQSKCYIHLHRFDKDGRFRIEGISEGNIIEWSAWKTVVAPSEQAVPETKLHYINPYEKNQGGKFGTFMTDNQQSLYPGYAYLSDCFVEFYDPETDSNVKVTFDLEVTTCDITGVTATLSDNIPVQDGVGVIPLVRDSELSYTTRIVNAKGAEANEPYTYSVTVTASEDGYEGGYVISSNDETIAKVENGVIVPKRDGTCTFTVTSEDDASQSTEVKLEFTLDNAETVEKEAAQPVIRLISVIAQKGNITTDNEDVIAAINAARTAYDALREHVFNVDGATGLGAQKKVYNYGNLLEAEYELAAYPVVVLINQIDITDISNSETATAITDARTAYDALLSQEVKDRVKNYNDLLNAENTLAAWNVDKLINAIAPESEINTEAQCEATINAAKEAYDAYLNQYSDDNKVTKSAALENAINTLAARKIEKRISQLGNEITISQKETIEQISKDYDDLLEDAKNKVKEGAVFALRDAENKLAALFVEKEIDDFGQVSLENLTQAQIKAIEAADNSFNALSELRQTLVSEEAKSKLVDAKDTVSAYEFKLEVDEVLDQDITADNADEVEEQLLQLQERSETLEENVYAKLQNVFNEISSARVEISDIRSAVNVEAQIKALGTITLNRESQVNLVRAAYDALSANSKKKVTNYAVLTAAESRIELLKEAAKQAQEAANAQKPQPTPTVKLSKVSLKVKAAKGKVKLTWKKSSKAQGYIIYRATKKNGTYKKIKVITKWKTTSYTDKKVKSKKQYFYKICPYKGTVKGPLSAAKKVKVK